MIDKKAIQNLNNAEFGKFSYDKNYEVKIEAGRQQGKSFRAGMEFSNKIWKDKIRAKIDYLLKRYDSEEDFCSYDVLISILKSFLK